MPVVSFRVGQWSVIICWQPDGCEDRHANTAMVAAPTVKLVIRDFVKTSADATRELATRCFFVFLFAGIACHVFMLCTFCLFTFVPAVQQAGWQAAVLQGSMAASSFFHDFHLLSM